MAAKKTQATPDEDLGIVDETPEEVDEDTFDLDEWIDGVEPTVHAVKIYQRADMLARYERLEQELRVAKEIKDSDRSVSDRGPRAIEQELIAVAEEIESSARWFKIQGLSDARRDAITKPLQKKNVSKDDIALYELEDAIISPKGVTHAHLRKLGERSESQLKMLMVAFAKACAAPPRVSAPLSDGSSAGRSTRGR